MWEPSVQWELREIASETLAPLLRGIRFMVLWTALMAASVWFLQNLFG